MEEKCCHQYDVGKVMEEQGCDPYPVGVMMEEKYCHQHKVGLVKEEQCSHQHEVGVVREEKCCHQYEVGIVMTAHTPDSLLQVGACVDEDWVWSSVDPLHVPVYCGGQRIREGLSVRTGDIGTLVSCHCVLCHHNNNTVLQHPALLWFGVGSHAPCVRASPGVVVEKGVVQLEEDRKAWCEGVDGMGSRVIVWGWGGKDDNRAVRGVAVVPRGVAVEHEGVAGIYGGVAVEHEDVVVEQEGVAVEHGGVAVVNEAEERRQSIVEISIDDTGKEEDFGLDDFFTQIYFTSLVWRLARKEPEMFHEKMERRWRILCGELEELVTVVFKEDSEQVTKIELNS